MGTDTRGGGRGRGRGGLSGGRSAWGSPDPAPVPVTHPLNGVAGPTTATSTAAIASGRARTAARLHVQADEMDVGGSRTSSLTPNSTTSEFGCSAHDIAVAVHAARVRKRERFARPLLFPLSLLLSNETLFLSINVFSFLGPAP